MKKGKCILEKEGNTLPCLSVMGFRRLVFLLAAFFIGAIFVACGAVPRVETPLWGDSRGFVSLKVFTTPTFRAQHPKSVPPKLMRPVLSGIMVQEQRGWVGSIFLGDTPPTPVFSEEEVNLLSRWLIVGLEKATPEEEVTFQLNGHHSTEKVYTSGSVYFSKGTFHIIIDRYRTPSSKAPPLSKPALSFSQPKLWKMSFRPQAALTSPHPAETAPYSLAIDLSIFSKAMSQNRPHKRSKDSFSSIQSQENLQERTSPGSSRQDLQDEMGKLRQSLEEQRKQIERLEREIHDKHP